MTARSARSAGAAAADALFHDVGWLHLGGHALLEGRQGGTALELLAEAARRGAPAPLDTGEAFGIS